MLSWILGLPLLSRIGDSSVRRGWSRVRRGVELGRLYTIFLGWGRPDSAARVLRDAYPDPVVFEAFVRTIAK